MAARPTAVQATAHALRRTVQPTTRAAVATASSSARILASDRRFLPSSNCASLAHARAFSTTPARSAERPARRPDFKKLDAEDVAYFKSVLSSPSSLVTTIPSRDGSWQTASEDDLVGYNVDWMDKYKGNSPVLVKPKTTDEVSKILAYCYKKRIAVVPQGGNTGLVGGGVPLYDELILSTEGMNQVRAFDDVSGILTADAGCILENLSTFLHPKGYMMPLDLGAKGSCHIGGNVATNAGGLRLLRYGSLHGTVLGIEAVLPDAKGTVLSVNMPGGGGAGALRKDNTGYDLKQLFIGSEGTLGVITGVSILTPRLPSAINVAVLSVPDFNSVQTVFKETRAQLGEILSAFEFFDQEGLEMVLHHTGAKSPFETEPENGRAFYVLIETSGSNKDHDDEKLGGLLESLLENETITDGTLAQDETQVQSLWSLRESLPEAAGKMGRVYKYDLSMPVKDMYSLVEEARERFKENGLDKDGSIKTTVGYGHIGDGNLHINIVAKDWDEKVEKVIEPWIYEATAKRDGSISAEHGLGVMKGGMLGYSKTEPAIAVMQQIRRLFDPRGILMPSKYLPMESELPFEQEKKEHVGAEQ
ncbi:D-lactate ferricytochrome c oxidoreductase [Rhodotorula toruloides]